MSWQFNQNFYFNLNLFAEMNILIMNYSNVLQESGEVKVDDWSLSA